MKLDPTALQSFWLKAERYMSSMAELLQEKWWGMKMSVTGIILTVLGMVVFGTLYGMLKEQKGRKVLVFKALATSMAVIVAIRHAVCEGGTASFLLVCAALLCLVADILLEIVLGVGVVAFAGAHVCFIGAFAMQCRITWYTLLIFFVCYLCFVIGLRKYLPQIKRMNQRRIISDQLFTIGALIYPTFLCGTTAMAITKTIQMLCHLWGSVDVPGGGQYLLACRSAVGGICFILSDYMLTWRKLSGKKQNRYRLVVLALYYSAVYLLVC